MKELIAIFGLLTMTLFLPHLSLAAKDSPIDQYIFGDFYQNAYHSLDAFLVKSRGNVEFVNGAHATTCAEYLEALKVSEVTDGVNNKMEECPFTGCVIAATMQRGKPHNGYRPKSYSQELEKRLDLRSFYNSLHLRFGKDTTKHTIADLKNPHVSLKDQYAVVIDEDDWFERIGINSDADFNGNGKPDWLISLFEKSIGGTLHDCNVFIVYDAEPTGLLKASEVPRQ